MFGYHSDLPTTATRQQRYFVEQKHFYSNNIVVIQNQKTELIFGFHEEQGLWKSGLLSRTQLFRRGFVPQK